LKPTSEEKLNILGKVARFDVSGFPCLFPSQKFSRVGFIYPAVARGRVARLFKVLQNNRCESNCLYCANRKERDFCSLELSPSELARLFFNYYQKGAVDGLFLSSAIKDTPDETEEKMLATVQILRQKYAYRGYIHLKILPGVDPDLIRKARKWVDRLSLNLEAPGASYLQKLSLSKDFATQLWRRLEFISQIHRQNPLKAGITTQFVVGGGEEKDKDFLLLTHQLYHKLGLRRVYYSAFTPILDTPLENEAPCPPLREYRLYQADFLLKSYGFTPEELPYQEGNLPSDKDPKTAWALLHPEKFPLEINQADYLQLIRIPGIGRISAQRILQRRRERKLTDISDLKGTGARTSQAKPFITLAGKFYSPDVVSSKEEEQTEQLFLWQEI